jgi:hypothetical protein
MPLGASHNILPTREGRLGPRRAHVGRDACGPGSPRQRATPSRPSSPPRREGAPRLPPQARRTLQQRGGSESIARTTRSASLQPGHTTGTVPSLVPSPNYYHQVLEGDEAGAMARGLPAGLPAGRDGRRQPHHPQPPPVPLRRRPSLAGGSASYADLQLGRPGQGFRWKFPRHVRAPWELLGSLKLPPAARGNPPRVHTVVFEAAHRAAQHHRLGCYRGVPRRHHLPRSGEQTGAQDSHQGERVDGHSHQVRLVRRRLKPSSGRTSSLRRGSRKTSPRRPPSRARRRRPRRSRKQSAMPLTLILSLLPSTGTLGSLPKRPTCSTRCSRSRAPITRVPSCTPLRNVSCFGATSIRPAPGGRWQRPRQQQERGRQGRGVPGDPRLFHDLWWASGERLGSAPQAGAPGGLLGEGGGAGLPRLVRQAHHLRPRRPPRLRAEPRKVPARCRSCHRQR